MSLTPHPYRGTQDLAALQDLLRAGIAHDPRLTYVHPGDIEWWFFYNPIYAPETETVTLWRTEAGDLAAWVLADVKDGLFNLFVHPAHRTDATFDHILAWLDVQWPMHPTPDNTIACEEVMRDDPQYQTALTRAGYTGKQYLMLFEQSLIQPPAPVALPEGFRFLDALENVHVDSRAECHRAAFTKGDKKSRMTPEHYRRFRTAPGYDARHDVCVVNERDEVVAFAMTWPDEALRIGEFEPVGTHPDYQRRGLGRATLTEGLRRLHARGMTQATVATGADDPQNIAFYQSAGFAIVNEVQLWSKPAPPKA